MSLRKSPRVTPAMLAANRANAKKSTGPRTKAGKARVRLNPLKRGNRCPSYQSFVKALLCGSERIDRLMATMLRPYELDHPLFATLIESWVSIVGAHGVRWIPGRDPEERRRAVRAKPESLLESTDELKNKPETQPSC